MKPAKTKLETLRVDSGLKEFVNVIISNSWIKQPELALGAALSLFAVLISRKFVYQGLAPNLYIANISPSGTGKSFPQEEIKKVLADIQADSIIGSGDYVSYASLMDGLQTKPTRLDIWDELGGILKTINKGNGDYADKMADALAELYTTSNSYYMGRATAEGNKGSCYRPNVSILGSTTPVGFEEGVTKTAIDKGLLGRFLIFQGDAQAPAQRVKQRKEVSGKLKQHMQWLFAYTAPETQHTIKDIPQMYTNLEADKEADDMLDTIFAEMDEQRREFQNTPSGPVIARLYQQMIKLVMIHAMSRSYREVPIIDKYDVMFGYELITFYQHEIGEIINTLIFNSPQERMAGIIKKLLRETGGRATKAEIIRATTGENRNIRKNTIEDMVDSGILIKDALKEDNKFIEVYFLV